MSALPSWITSAGELTGFDLELDTSGLPVNPVVVIDGDSVPAGDAAVARLAARVSRTLAITAVVGRNVPPPDALVNVADVVLVHPDVARSAVAGRRTTVGTEDPIATAEAFREAAQRAPRAALTLTWLLRAGPRLSVADALAAESTAYSSLLAGAEFHSWLSVRPPRRPADGGDRIRIERTGDVLRIVLARPGRRNAVDHRMRDALVEALRVAEADPGLRVELSADGPSFSAGGDLDEFGSAADPAAAHLVRMVASPGRLMHELRSRITVRVHGACIGAGIELPAFAGRIISTADAVFALPEVGMGLIPGAGGTVSVPRRIGRGRCLWLAVSGAQLDAETALDWGLVDELA